VLENELALHLARGRGRPGSGGPSGRCCGLGHRPGHATWLARASRRSARCGDRPPGIWDWA